MFPRSAIVVLLLLLWTINTAPAQTTLSAEDIAQKALAATVYLEMQDKNGKTLGIGSGFFVKSNLIATNYHVIEGAAKGTAKLVGKYTTYNIEGVTATDKINDLVLLKVTAYGIKPLSLGDSDTVRIGETVYVSGNPKGLEGTFSDGIISSRRDRYTKERLQMTAPISPGSSGGPVLNRKGEVIGVSFAGHRASDAQNLNFAIPSKYLKTLSSLSRTAKPLGQNNVFISADTYFRRGYAKAELGDYKGAIADYTEGIRLKPNDANAYYNRGTAKAKLGKYVTAIADYNIAIQLKPGYTLAYYNRGNAKKILKQYFAAITDYDEAIRLKPDFTSALGNRGIVKYNLRQYSAAIVDYDTIIRLEPDGAYTADAYHYRGMAKSKLGQHADAIVDYSTAIRLKPDWADFYYNRGISKSKLGQYGDAIVDYNIAIQLEPNGADSYGGRGHAKSKLGQYSDAIVDYNIAIQLEPDDAEAYHNRGVAKAILGRVQEAKQDIQTALKLAEKLGNIRLKAQIIETLRLMK